MIRVGFTAISGQDWTGTGIYNYFLNLMQILTAHSAHRIQPVMFAGTDAMAINIAPLAAIAGLEIIHTSEFDEARRGGRLRESLLLGYDHPAARVFTKHGIDVVFESAQFHGWRFPFPTISWLPDFQHRRLKTMFSFKAYWKRDLGFRAQVFSGRHIMLSSEDSRSDCERFFPNSVGRTSVVRFSVPSPELSDDENTRDVPYSYNLPERFFYLPNQFWNHKNHRTVIEALDILKQQGRNFVVAASGKTGDYRHPDHYNSLRSLVESRGLTNNFRFLGVVPRPHVFALLRSCTALLNPSLSEGWSTTVEEAKALGVPMLLSNLPVHMEQAGDSAYFFNPRSADQLASLMSRHETLSPSARRERERSAGAAARRRTIQFAEDFANAAENALASNRRTSTGAMQSNLAIGGAKAEGVADS